jgi:hypothetical protein
MAEEQKSKESNPTSQITFLQGIKYTPKSRTTQPNHFLKAPLANTTTLATKCQYEFCKLLTTKP